MQSSSAATVELLPEEVGPVTSTIPLRRLATSARCEGRCREAKSGIVVGITRITMAQLPRWMKALTRNRASPGKPYEMSHDPCSRSVLIACLLLPIRSAAIRRVSSAVRVVTPATCTLVNCPYTSTWGGRPGEKIRSLTLSDARSIAANKPGVDPAPDPEMPSSAADIALPAAAITLPHTSGFLATE